MQWKSHCFLIDVQIVFSLHRMTHSRITRMYWQSVLQSFYLTLCFPIMSVRAWSKMILYIHLDSFWLPPEVYRRCYLYSCSLRLQTLYGKQWLETTEQHYCNHIQSKWLLWRCASGLRLLLFSCCLQSDFGAWWWRWIRNKTVLRWSISLWMNRVKLALIYVYNSTIIKCEKPQICCSLFLFASELQCGTEPGAGLPLSAYWQTKNENNKKRLRKIEYVYDIRMNSENAGDCVALRTETEVERELLYYYSSI